MTLSQESAQLSVTVRPLRAEDGPFLRALYASTREAEMALVDWTGDQKSAFLEMQFELQHRAYLDQFRNAEFLIVQLGAQPIGRLYVDRRADEIRILDIALVPQHRGSGIGRSLLQGVLDEAAQTGQPVRLHVERFNRALRLYQRLGFSVREDNGVSLLLEWIPGHAAESGRGGQ